MKFIPSRTHALQKENEALLQRVEQQDAHIQRLQRTCKNLLARQRSGPANTESIRALSPVTTDLAEIIPSYIRPTAASRARAMSVTMESADTVRRSSRGGSTVKYDDGGLIPALVAGETRFLNHTHTSATRAGLRHPGKQASEWNRVPTILDPTSRRIQPVQDTPSPVEDSKDIEPWLVYHSTLEDAKAEIGYEPQRQCCLCRSMQKELRSDDPECLHISTRLWDEDFYSQDPASKCFVPLKLQFRLLRTALRLAQDSLWNALRTHWPEFQLSRYLEGPCTIRFGRDELYSAFGGYEYPNREMAMCGSPRADVVGAVMRIADVRNAICHPSHNSTKVVDVYLQAVQSLAVTLLDKRRAMTVRKLRDDLQDEARKGYNLIRDYALFPTLPHCRRPWPLHHQRFLHEVRLTLRDDCWGHMRARDIGPVIRQAAMDWSLKYCEPGEMNPDYLARVEKAKTFMNPDYLAKCEQAKAFKRVKMLTVATPEGKAKLLRELYRYFTARPKIQRRVSVCSSIEPCHPKIQRRVSICCSYELRKELQKKARTSE